MYTHNPAYEVFVSYADLSMSLSLQALKTAYKAASKAMQLACDDLSHV